MAGEGGAGTSNEISGGTFNGPVLQAGQVVNPVFFTSQAAAAPVALAQLPSLTAGFTGREAELTQVAGLLDSGAGAVVVSAVAGLAGVGKTALAVQAAHAAREAGWFPGGVLFIDLHGYDERPVQPGQALDALLRALGVPGEHIPEGAELRAGLYRSALAQLKGPVLLVADNASAEVQVRPLLPGPGPHRVLITSRHTLAGLGARLLDVTVLDEAAAVGLLDGVLRMARPGDDRVSGDEDAAERLARACGGLPLALQITAALLVGDLALSTRELANRLASEVNRLEALHYSDGSETSALSVAAAFELSYRLLDAETARLFRLLPVNPGPDVSTAAAGALAGWPPDRARTVLGRLAKAHLVEAASGEASRWRMHDLLRLYARQLSGTGIRERKRAINRLLAYYLNRADAANAHLKALKGAQVPAVFTDREEALAWLDAERPNLIATVVMAAETRRDQLAISLPFALARYLDWRRRFDDGLTVQTICRDAARRQGELKNAAAALHHLGLVLREMRRFEEAIIAHQDAVTTFRRKRDREGERQALDSLGNSLAAAGRVEEAITAHQDSAALHRKASDRPGEGRALTNLSAALRAAGRFEEAIQASRKAIAIHQETGDRHTEALALANLGAALREAQQLGEAIGTLKDAAAVFQETGDRHGEGMALNNLGAALRDVRRFEEAITAHQEAAALYREAGDRHGEGMALNSLGLRLRRVRRFEEAITAHQEAAALYREAGDRHGEGEALNNLGLALRDVRRFEEAIACYQQDIAICQESGDRHGEGQTLENLGDAYQQMRQLGLAAACWREAAAAMRDAGDLEEAARLEQLAADA